MSSMTVDRKREQIRCWADVVGLARAMENGAKQLSGLVNSHGSAVYQGEARAYAHLKEVYEARLINARKALKKMEQQ
jgi:hypothetical protein